MTLTEIAQYHQTRFKQVIFLQEAIKGFYFGHPEQQVFYRLFMWSESMHMADEIVMTKGFIEAKHLKARGRL